MAKNTIKALPMGSLNSAAVLDPAAWYPIFTGGSSHPLLLVRLTSDSTKGYTISYDGVDEHDFLPSGGSFEIPAQSNALPVSGIAMLPVGFNVYVQGAAGVGMLYASAYYQEV